MSVPLAGRRRKPYPAAARRLRPDRKEPDPSVGEGVPATASPPPAAPCGVYLYAIVAGGENREYGATGIDGASVYTIPSGRRSPGRGLAAVVSDISDRRIRPERRRLAAHHNVLRKLMDEHAVLPASFGVIADGAEAVRRMLAASRVPLAQELHRVAGKIEMGLRVRWDVPNVFEFLVNTHADLRLLRDQIFGGGREPSRDDKIRLGRLFERTVNEERAAHTKRVVNVLKTRCCEIREKGPRDEREVAHLACLVRKRFKEDFEQGVFKAAGLFDDNYALDFNGPHPSFSFVNVQLEAGAPTEESGLCS